MTSIGLRARVALAIALLTLAAAGTVSAATYAFARWYLAGQREASALTRSALDARAVMASLTAGDDPPTAMAQAPSIGASQVMMRIGDDWYTSSVAVAPDALPPSLIAAAAAGGGQQRFAVGDNVYYAVALPLDDGVYVEVFAMRDLDTTLTWGGWILVVLTAFTALVGALIGAALAGRILRPLGRLRVAARSIAGGELTTRIALTGDADLDPIAESFNEMATAVEGQIVRERRFSANVSHELRSPVSAALGTAELLEARADRLPEREAHLLGVLSAQVRRMSRVLLDLLEISRLSADDPPQFETADIAALCREAVARAGLDDSLVHGDTPMVRTDARRLERIVTNLVDNAQRHGEGVRAVIVERGEGVYRIAVEDDGPGIEPEARERVFEPFTRGQGAARTEGAGLGLAIVRDQARALGGDIRVEGVEPHGARFVVTLPVVAEDT